MNTYCIFCKTGVEKKIAENINKVDKNIKALAPIKIVQEKRRGKWESKERLLLPGYVFLYSEDEINSEIRNKVSNIYKLLNYEEGLRELMGTDYEYSMWLYRHHGSINSSKVLKEGKKVTVIEGPLLDGVGQIVRLDKHKKRVWIEVDFDGIKRTLSLSAECVDTID